MTSPTHAVVVDTDPLVLAAEARALLAEIARDLGAVSLTGECVPPLDVFETEEAVEILVDLPGVEPAAVRVVAKGNAVLIAGMKVHRRARTESSFHLVERGYGRFARTVVLTSACDPTRATASLHQGELRITLPRLRERRCALVPIPLSSEPTVS